MASEKEISEAQAYLDSIKNKKPELKAEVPQEDTSNRLAGRIEFTPEMQKTEQRDAELMGLPRKGESDTEKGIRTVFALPSAVTEGAVRGLEEVPETIGNFALGGVQQSMNVPPQKRMTIGDIGRKINPGFVSPSEHEFAPHFQQALQQNPLQAGIYNASKFAGGFAVPVGEAVNALAKPAFAALKMLPGAVPTARVGQNIANIARNSTPNWILNQTKFASPVARMAGAGAATGAGYAAPFYGGQQFAQSRELPAPQDYAAPVAAGAAMGGGLGAGLGTLGQWLLKRRLQALAQQSQLAENPSIAAPERKILPEAPVVGQKIQTGLDKLAAKYPNNPQQLQKVGKRFMRMQGHAYNAESPEHELEVAKGERRLFGIVRNQASEAEQRQYAEQRYSKRRQEMDARAKEKQLEAQKGKQENRQYAQGQKQENVKLTGQHTETSGDTFENLSKRIERSASRSELSDMRNEIFNPGTGPKGQRLLDTAQQRELEKQWRKRYIDHGKKEGTPPGESAREPEPEKPPESPQEEPNKPEAQPSSEPVKKFLLGAFRKIINKKEYGPRETRYKVAVSVEALGKAAGFSPEETEALNKWVSALSETRRELTYKDMQIAELAKWAMEHEDQWIGEQYDVKARQTTDKATRDDAYVVLEQKGKEQNTRKILLRARMENSWQDAVEENLEHEKVNLERYGRKGYELKTLSRATVRTTTSGKAKPGSTSARPDGSLDVKGGLEKLSTGEFSPPKTADELYSRLEDLLEWQKHFREQMTDIKHGTGEYDYLHDGTTPTELMGHAFENLKLPYIDGKPPDTHVWHIDSTGHVSTTAFQQPRTTVKDVGELHGQIVDNAEAADKIIDEFRSEDGKIDYDALFGNKQMMNKLFSYFPGLGEIGILAALFGKPAGKLAAQTAKAAGIEAFFAGAIDDIFRSNSRFGGDDVSRAFHIMLGEVNANFFHDSSGIYHRVKSAEDLADLLNQFKGTKLTRSNFRKQAVENLELEKAKSAEPITQADLSDAYKKADTALMIRQHYQRLAVEVNERIEEMNIRRKDAQSGNPSREGKKFYTPDDYHSDGRVKKSAYNSLYHTALIELHKGLTLQPSSYGQIGGAFFDNAAARKSMSIMANNPRVALKNFFDQAPITLAYFGQHFITAAIDLTSNPEIRESILRLPIIPQADMSHLQLMEGLRDTRPPTNLAEKIKRVNDWINVKASTVLDPLFHGSTTLVSFADRQYAKVSALASLYKQASERGENGREFVENLMNGGFTKEQEQHIFGQMSKDLTQTLNTVNPSLNKDLFASSTLGKVSNQYSTPGRRAMKLMTNWIASDNPADKMKAAAAMYGLIALGGSGAIPVSVQTLYRLGAAITGNNKDAERNIQWFDQWNLLRTYAGVNYSNSFGPDFFTGAAPTYEAISKAIPAAISAAKNSASEQEAIFRIGAAIAFEGLSVLPKIGPIGWDQWKGLLKNVNDAGNGQGDQGAGHKEVYFTYNGALHKIDLNDYGYPDALHDFMIGGINPKAYEAIKKAKLDLAERADEQTEQNRSIIPTKETNPVLPLFNLKEKI